MVRKRILKEYGRDAYNQGMIAHTTLSSEMQRSAEDAVRKNYSSTIDDTDIGGRNIEEFREQTSTLPHLSTAIPRIGQDTVS